MSDKKYITKGEGLPNWSNPISHAVVVNNMCFVSGQVSVSNEGNYIPGTALEEARIAFSNFFSAIKIQDLKKQILFLLILLLRI